MLRSNCLHASVLAPSAAGRDETRDQAGVVAVEGPPGRARRAARRVRGAIRAVAAISVVLGCSALPGQRAWSAAFNCPSVPGPYPKPPVVLDTYGDGMGGTFSLTCTNASATGDFVWTYQGAGVGAPLKTIGRCIFVGGQNNTEVVNGANGKPAYWVHTCLDGPGNNSGNPVGYCDDGRPWCLITNVFDIANCREVRLCQNFVGGKWVENVAQRQYTSAADFGALTPSDQFKKLTSGLYPDPPPPLPAVYESRIDLVTASGSGGMVKVNWDLGAHDPTFKPGEYVLLKNTTTAEVASLDPHFSATDTPDGLKILDVSAESPATGMTLLSLNPAATKTLNYSIVDPGSDSFYGTLFTSPSTAIENIRPAGFSSVLTLEDMPAYVGTYGSLAVPEPSSVFLIGTGGLVLLGFARRRRKLPIDRAEPA